MAIDWSIVADVTVGYLLANAVRLIVVKAFLEPSAAWAGRWLYRRADQLSGDRLPNWIPPTSKP